MACNDSLMTPDSAPAAATLKIGGMHCASCVSHVERAILRVPGVRGAMVNLATGKGRVEFEPAAVGGGGDATGDRTAAIVNAVVRAGYSASIDDQPELTTGAGGGADEAALWRRRAILGGVLGLPVVVLGMAWMTTTSAWLQLAPAAVVQVLLGGAFVVGAWRGLRSRRVDMDALVAIGTLAAFGWSVVALVRGDHHPPHVYFDTSVVILTLIALGKYFEARARARAVGAMTGLLALVPRSAAVLVGGSVVDKPVEQLGVGESVLVRTGERAAVDGVVIDGLGEFDESLVSGESAPVVRQTGDTVVGGALCVGGTVTVRATGVGSASTVAQIAALVAEAQAQKSHVQRLADSIAGVFVPVVLVIAAATLLGWGLVGGDWPRAVWAAVSVLIVACPCALGLAVPTAVMVGTGVGAQAGIVIKDPAVLERAGGLRTVVIDKTGTLTCGEPEVVNTLVLEPGLDVGRALAIAAALERLSTHPIARAIVAAAGVGGPAAAGTAVLPGEGVFGEVGGKWFGVVAPGRAADASQWRAKVDELEREGASVVALVEADEVRRVVPGRTLALVALRDEPRPEAAMAVERLRAMDLRTVLLTGDSETAARAVAQAVGIHEVRWRVSPADKERVVRELAVEGPVAMVGDGLNDAPALAAADIGIAMGSGTHIAASAGHVILVGGDLRSLPRAVVLSRAMMTRIRMGLFWALAYNVVLIPVAAAGWLDPVLAAVAMSLSSVSVVLNALALKRVKLD